MTRFKCVPTSAPAVLLGLILSACSGERPSVPSPTAQAPTVSGVTVDGGGTQVRQGRDDLRVTVVGAHFGERPTAFLGSISVTVEAGSDDRTLHLRARLPHGQDRGPLALKVRTPGGSTVRDGALDVTAITSGPDGSDLSGDGTPTRPFRSLRAALQVSAEGDFVTLLAGRYDAEHGESWVEGPEFGERIPNGVNVTGEAGVTLSGPGGGDGSALDFEGAGSLADVSMQNFGTCVGAFSATAVQVHLDGLDLEHCVVSGVSTNGAAQVTLSGGRIHGGDVGIRAQGQASLTLEGTHIDHNELGLLLGDQARAALSLTEIDHHDGAALGGVGVIISGSATLTADKSTIHDNRARGVLLRGAGQAKLDKSLISGNGVTWEESAGIYLEDSSSLVLKSSEVSGNGLAGISVGGTANTVTLSNNLIQANRNGVLFAPAGGALKMRDNTVKDNADAGIYIGGAASVLDLGDAAESGRNVVSGNGGCALEDQRPPRALADGPVVTLNGTSLNGTTYQTPFLAMGPFNTSGVLCITGTNNRVGIE